jgi:hypothetical protein
LSSKYEIRFLKPEEYDLWDKFVDESPQGTIFSKTYWLSNTAQKFSITGCFRDSILIAGIPFEEKKKGPLKFLRNPKLTQFLGFHFNKTKEFQGNNELFEEKNIVLEILRFLEKQFNFIAINNNYLINDIRPFIWNDYHVEVRFSYMIKLDNINQIYQNMEYRVKYDVKKCEKSNIIIKPTDDLQTFYDIHASTYKMQNLKCPESFEQIKKLYLNLKKLGEAQLFFAQNNNDILSTSLIVWHEKVAYYLMGGVNRDFRHFGSSNFLMWYILQELAKKNVDFIDLYGANSPRIALFKRGFGGKLDHYFRVLKFTTVPLEILYQGGKFIQSMRRLSPYGGKER